MLAKKYFTYIHIGEETLQPLDESFSPGGRTSQIIDSFRMDVKSCHDQFNGHCGELASHHKCLMFGS